jgi:hypothetical protein
MHERSFSIGRDGSPSRPLARPAAVLVEMFGIAPYLIAPRSRDLGSKSRCAESEEQDRHDDLVFDWCAYLAMPTIFSKCFFCSIASSMNAATALRAREKPIFGAAPSRLR